MEKDLISAGIFLRALLPLLEKICSFDEEAKEIIKGWNLSLMLHFPGEGTTLFFKDGRLKVRREKVLLPSIALYFTSPAKVVKMMFGEKVIPLPWWGIWRISVLKNFEPLAKKIEKYLQADEEFIKDEKNLRFVVSLYLNLILYGVKEVGEKEEKADKIISNTPDGVLQINVLPDGPYGYLQIREGRIYPGEGKWEGKVNAFMEFASLKAAYELFTRRLDGSAGIGLLKIRVRGNIPLVEVLDEILGKLPKYLPEI